MKIMKKNHRNIAIVSIAGIALIIILIVQSYPLSVAPLNGGGGGGDLESGELRQIIPYPNTDGNILLRWGALDTTSLEFGESVPVHYEVFRSTDGGSWLKIFEGYDVLTYEDEGLYDGEYRYYIRSSVFVLKNIVVQSNVVSITVNIPGAGENLPFNPSIIINDGAKTTNSLTITLTLSCDDADEMRFQIDIGIWTEWTAYSTTHILMLNESNLYDDKFYIGVVFRNADGTTEDAGYKSIRDDITYVAPNGDGDGDGEGYKIDYTLIYVLVGVLVGLVGVVIFMKYRKIKPK